MKQWIQRLLAVLLIAALLCPAELPALAEATAAPQVTAEPTVTAAPEITAEPTTAPDATAEPTETEEPQITVEPEKYDSAESTADPDATATPEPDETATPAPDTTATPDPDETATPEPEETAAPEPVFALQPLTVAVKQALPLTAENAPEGEEITYSSSNKKICTVDEQGNVKGVAKGKAVITAAAAGGETAQAEITVIAAPSKVTISQTSAKILTGDTLQLSYTLPANTGATVKWTSSKPAVAAVDENGLVTALTDGTATIKAETHNGKSASCKVTVLKAPGWIKANEETVTLGEGMQSGELFAIEGGTSTRLSYTYLHEGEELSRSESEFATVLEDGTLKAELAGSVAITATTHNGHSATVNVEIIYAPEEFSLSAEEMTLGAGQRAALTYELPEGTAAHVTYSSSKPKVATVDRNGNIKAVKAGTAVITVSTHNEVERTCTVTVVNAPSKIVLDKTYTALYPGLQEQLTYKLPKNSAASVTWSVKGSAVTVAPDGTVTGVKAGTADITVKTHNGKKDTLKVYVYDAPETLSLTETQKTLGAGQKFTLKPETDATHYRMLQFESSDPAVASVEASGAVKALSAGDTVLTVRSLDGALECAMNLHVDAAPAKVTLPVKSLSMGIGDTYQLLPQVEEGCHEEYAYSISSKIASVSKDGLVTAKKTGKVKVTVKTYNGKKATLTVTVKKAPGWISAAQDQVIVGVGQQVRELFSISSKAATTLTYAFGTEGVLEMSGGVLTAQTEGSTSVTATTHNGLTASTNVVVYPAPEEFTLSETALEMGVGQKGQLTYELPEGTAAEVTYSCDQPKILSVGTDGALKALKTGTAVVTVSTHNGVTRQCEVTVKSAPKKISLNDSEIVLYVGVPAAPRYTITANTSAAVKWSVSNKKLITVNDDGTLTAKGTGTAKVTVTTHNGKTSTRTVYCYNAPTYMELKQTSPLELGVGQKLEIRPDTDAVHYRMLNFSSSDPSVAYIARTGMLTAKTPGIAIITVRTLDDSIVRTLEVNVYDAPSKVTLSPSSVMLGVGDEYTMHPDLGEDCRAGLTYERSNKVVSVTADGVITALKTGTSKVKVTTHNGKSAVLNITVVNPPNEITLSESAVLMEPEQTWELEYTLPKGTASIVTWTSDDADVCTVDENGVVTAIGVGSATITATTLNGLSAQCKATIVEPAATIETPESVSLSVGEFEEIGAKAYTEDGSAYQGTITAVSGDTSVVKIASDGRLYGRQAGECTVQVTAGKQSATVNVVVISGTNDSRRDIIVSSGLEKIGCTYVFAATGPSKFDCSGFVRYCYKQVGITLKHSAYYQGYTEGFRIERDELLPGDIVCFNTNLSDDDLVDHTGIYLGNDKFVHASSSAGKVIISDMSKDYYYERFSWGRRVLD